MEQKAFVEQAAHIVRRAMDFSEKARREGLLALEDKIDEGLAARGDAFERGLRLAVNGAETGAIEEALSQMIVLETDENARRLKTMQKAAVMCIRVGENSRMFQVRAPRQSRGLEFVNRSKRLSRLKAAESTAYLKVFSPISSRLSTASYFYLYIA